MVIIDEAATIVANNFSSARAACSAASTSSHACKRSGSHRALNEPNSICSVMAFNRISVDAPHVMRLYGFVVGLVGVTSLA